MDVFESIRHTFYVIVLVVFFFTAVLASWGEARHSYYDTENGNGSDSFSQPAEGSDVIPPTTIELSTDAATRSGNSRLWGAEENKLRAFTATDRSLLLNGQEKASNATNLNTTIPPPPDNSSAATDGQSLLDGLLSYNSLGYNAYSYIIKRVLNRGKYSMDSYLLNMWNVDESNENGSNQERARETRTTTQPYDFTDDAGAEKLSPSRFSSRYNISTPFIVDCLRHRRAVHLQPGDGELHFHIEEDDPIIEDIANTERAATCSMKMVLPSNKALVVNMNLSLEESDWLVYQIHQDAIDKTLATTNIIFTSGSVTPAWDRKVYTAAGDQIWITFNVFNCKIRPGQFVDLNFSLIDPSDSQHVEQVYVSNRTGYLQSRGFDGYTDHMFGKAEIWTEIRSHPGMLMMISLPFLHIGNNGMCLAGKLSIHTRRRAQYVIAEICADQRLSPFIIQRSAIYILFQRRRALSHPLKGFKIQYSFHEKWARLQRVSGGKWNCSMAQWSEYRHHFFCNMISDCVDGTDEVTCPYISTRCGPGQFLAGDRCYIFVHNDRSTMMTRSAVLLKCQERGGRLISLNSREEWIHIGNAITEFRHTAFMQIGLRTTLGNMPQIYSKALKLADSSIAYFFLFYVKPKPKPFCVSLFITLSFDDAISIGCNEKENHDYMCEIGPAAEDNLQAAEKKKQTGGALRASTMLTLREGSAFSSTRFAVCPDGHVTHVFLACDVQSACWIQRDSSCTAPVTPLPRPFVCSDRLQQMSYTLVCDFRIDCNDNSDESFCEHPPCVLSEQFECRNGQCVDRMKMCDYVEDCLDGSDEVFCTPERTGMTPSVVTGPTYVSFTRNGEAVLVPFRPVSNTSQHHPTPSDVHLCPDQYFGCASSPLCFPVHTRCNGVNDCPDREDESDCDSSYKCPGLFRCRGSRLCVAPSEICDGIYHCPQRDDELTCTLNCPATCICHGLTFFCRGSTLSFRPDEYQHLRYLDASGSGLKPRAVVNNTMLIHLDISNCGLTELELVKLPNLHSLDLSDNLLTDITDERVSGMPHLRYLTLSSNPLTSIFRQSGRKSSSSRIMSLDLSHVIMAQLSLTNLSMFPSLQVLNLTGCRVDTLLGSGLHIPKALRVLDVRGCPLTHFQANFFQSLRSLEKLFADNYKLCCPLILPPDFNLAHCKAPSDEVSSCENLLRSNMYRVFLALFSGLALSGNIVVFVSRVFLSKARNGFEIFTVMLCVSDFLMGIYLAIIGVADRLYLGTYVWNDVTWRRSITCSLTGFLSMVSNEVSAFIICLITLDRFLVLRFPFSKVRFNRTSGIVASGFVWVVGIVLAAVPLLPPTAYWRFYAVNGICVPLPITRQDFPGHRYSFSLLIVFNFVLFVLIALGQLLICLSVQKNSLRVGTSKGSRKFSSRDLAMARRLILVAVTDFVCWFPIGLLGILASNGVSISGEVNVAMAIFVLPLNSAINPFLYTVNKMLETRRVKREQRLLNQLLKQAKQQAGMNHAEFCG